MARKMKDSGIEWIGEIPEGWKTCLYKYCCSVQPRYPFDSAKFSNSSTDGFPIIRIRDITSGEIQTYYTGESSPNYIVTAGDLLVGMDGDFNVRWWNNDDALLNQRCCRVTEKDSVLRRFLYYVLPFTLQHINTLTYATTVKHLANGDILNSFIAFPSLPAQQNIVHYLDTVCSKIDSMLSTTRSGIEEYKKLKQAVITQAVTKGVRGEQEMKDSGVEWIGEINHRFSLIKLKYICSILDQYRKPISADKRSQSGSILYDYYGASGAIDKIDDYTIDDHVMLIGEDGANLRMRNLPLMYEVNGKAWINNHAHILKPTERVDFYYLFYALEGLDINPYITGSAQPKLSQENLQNIWVPLPNLEEQQEIATHIRSKCTEIDGLIAKKEQLVKELESYKKSLIYEIVTGKREV